MTRLRVFILVPILTKTLGAYEYGIWSRLIVIIFLLTLMVSLGLPSSIIKFLSGEKDKEKIQDGYYSSLVVVFFVALFVAMVLFLSAKFLAITIFKSEHTIAIFQFMGIILIGSALEDITHTLFLVLNYIKTYALLILFGTFAEITLILFSVSAGYGLTGAIIAFCATKLIIFLVELFLAIKWIGIKFPRFKDLFSYIQLGLPLMAAGLTRWIVKSSDLFIIGFLMTSVDVGIYSVSYTIGCFILIGLTPLQTVLRPMLAKIWEKSRMDEIKIFFSYSIKYFVAFAIPTIFGSYILAKPIISIISKQEFVEEGWVIIPIIALSSLFNGIYVIAVWIFSLIEKTKYVTTMWIFAAFLNIVMNLILIPKIGIIGAAFSTLIGYMFVAAISSYVLFRETKVYLDFLFTIKCIIASIIMTFILQKIMISTLVELLIALSLGVVVYFVTLFALRGFSQKEKVFFWDYLFGAL